MPEGHNGSFLNYVLLATAACYFGVTLATQPPSTCYMLLLFCGSPTDATTTTADADVLQEHLQKETVVEVVPADSNGILAAMAHRTWHR